MRPLLLAFACAACGPAAWPGPAPGSGKCTVETWGAPFDCVVHTPAPHLTLAPPTNDVPGDQPVAIIVAELVAVGDGFIGQACGARYDLGFQREREEWQSKDCRVTIASTTRTGMRPVVQGTVEATLENPQGGTQKLYAGF